MMGKNFFTKPRLEVNNGSIVVYYFHKNMCRYPTGISISNRRDKKSNFVEWDNKSNSLKPTVEYYQKKTDLLNDLLKWVTDIVESKYTQEGIILTGKELSKLLLNNYQINQLLKSNKIREHYDKFIELKRKTFIKKPQSLKDYTSLRNLLESFEIYYDKTILFRDYNETFLDELLTFMEMEHPKEIERNGVVFKFKTKGQLVKDTQRKRLDCLKEFKNYLVKHKQITQSDFIERKRSGIKQVDKKKVTLTIEEIHKLYDTTFNNKKLNETKDLFVFLCFLGIRWSDLTRFDNRFIRKNGNNWVYEFTPVKTEDSSSVDCYIPMCEIVKEILKKYDFKLNKIIKSNSDFNESLKIVCKESGLFNEITRTKNKETGSYKYRYELITSHKGRDTFITNLIDSTPINEIMKYTGHSKVSTLMSYVDKSRQVNSNYVKIFDR